MEGWYHERLSKFVLYVVAFLVLPVVALVLGGRDPKKWWSCRLCEWFGFDKWSTIEIDDYRLTQWRLEVAGLLKKKPTEDALSPSGPITYIHHYESLADLFFHDMVTNHSTMLMTESRLAFLSHCLQALVVTFIHQDLWPSGPRNIEPNLDKQFLSAATTGGTRSGLAAYPQTILSLDGSHIVELAAFIDHSRTPNIVEYLYQKKLPVKIIYHHGTSRRASRKFDDTIQVMSFPAISAQAIKSPDALQVLIQRSLRLACRWNNLDRLKKILNAMPSLPQTPAVM